MYRTIAKAVVGKKPETMEWTAYHKMTRNAESTLRKWVNNALCVIVTIALMVGMAAALVYAMGEENNGYYCPNPAGVEVEGMPYHYHVDGCDICE